MPKGGDDDDDDEAPPDAAWIRVLIMSKGYPTACHVDFMEERGAAQ